jgi:hypothetical protein
MAKIGGDPQATPGDVFATSITPQATVGSHYVSEDGRGYRYAQFDPSNNLVAGNLLQGVIPVLNHQHLTVATGASAGMGSLGQNPSIVVTLGATSGSAGFYSNGYAVVDSGSGHLGQCYSIVSNTTAASSGTMTIVLGEPLQTTIVAGTDTISLVPNQYQGVIQNPTTVTGVPVGVALTAGTAGWYGYIQTRGIASVLADANVAAKGIAVQGSTTTAGSVTATNGTSFFIVGNAVVATVSARANPVFLTLE